MTFDDSVKGGLGASEQESRLASSEEKDACLTNLPTIDVGDLVIINDEIMGLVLKRIERTGIVYYHTLYTHGGYEETRWVAHIFVEKCLTNTG